MENKMTIPKISEKHKAIVRTIIEKGKYRPAYSDQEPATATLEKAGIVEWNGSFTGVILTEYGQSIKHLYL